jgi:hypothetical protein
MGGVATAPIVGRMVDRVVPWFATVIAILGSLAFYSIQLGAAGVNVAAVVVVTFGIDVFKQTQQVSLTTGVFGLDPAARSRMNASMIISVRFMLTAFASTVLIVGYRYSLVRLSVHLQEQRCLTHMDGAPLPHSLWHFKVSLSL